MRIKPIILASNPRSIIMPATGLYQTGKTKIDFDNKAKNDISMPTNRLRRLNLASFSNALPHNWLAGSMAESQDLVWVPLYATTAATRAEIIILKWESF
jgi:hypothetical protein